MLRPRIVAIKVVATTLVAAAALFAGPASADAGTYSVIPLAHDTYVRTVRNYHHRYGKYHRHGSHYHYGTHRRGVRTYRSGPAYHYRSYRTQPYPGSYYCANQALQHRRPSRATEGHRTGYRAYDGGHYSFRRSGVRYSGYRRGFP